MPLAPPNKRKKLRKLPAVGALSEAALSAQPTDYQQAGYPTERAWLEARLKANPTNFGVAAQNQVRAAAAAKQTPRPQAQAVPALPPVQPRPQPQPQPLTDLEDLRIRSGLPRVTPQVSPTYTRPDGTPLAAPGGPEQAVSFRPEGYQGLTPAPMRVPLTTRSAGQQLTELTQDVDAAQAPLPAGMPQPTAIPPATSQAPAQRPRTGYDIHLEQAILQRKQATNARFLAKGQKAPYPEAMPGQSRAGAISPQDQANFTNTLNMMVNSPVGYSAEDVRNYRALIVQAGGTIPRHLQALIDTVGSKAEGVSNMRAKAYSVRTENEAERVLVTLEMMLKVMPRNPGDEYYSQWIGQADDFMDYARKNPGASKIQAAKQIGDLIDLHQKEITEAHRRAATQEFQVGMTGQRQARADEKEARKEANADAEKRNVALAKVAERKLDDVDKRIEQVRKEIEKAEKAEKDEWGDPDTVKKLTDQLEGPGGLVEQHEALFKDWETKMTGQPAQQAPAGQAGQVQPQPAPGGAALAAPGGTAVPDQNAQANWPLRHDGTKKGTGFLGIQKTTNGGVATELTIGVSFDGKPEMEIPTYVPTLTKEELDWLNAGGNPLDKSPIGKSIYQKAISHALERLRAGKSPFIETDKGELPSVKTDADFDRLPSGTDFIGPNGKKRRKK